MDFGWETTIARLKRHMNISPKRKLELLYELNCFTRKYAVRKRADVKLDKRIKEVRSRYRKQNTLSWDKTKHSF